MKILKPVYTGLKKPIKALKVNLKQKAGWLGTPKILPYRGFGNNSEIFLQGMVIEDKGLAKPDDRHRVWHNVLAMIKRFSSDEIPGVRVKAGFYGLSQVTETDENGFFNFHFDITEIPDEILKKHWHPFSLVLMDEITEDQPEITATGQVRIVSKEEKRIIVSDIDDTVLISHSTQTFRKLKLMLLKNALTRLPFKGVTAFYKALERGENKTSFNPFFYVSSSEWNLYDLLENFFDHNSLPNGVFMLRKLEHSILKFWKSGQGNHEHKYEKIKFLLELYASQNFILIGDSGQKDPEIYNRLAHSYPGRIETIYIRRIGSERFFKDIKPVITALEEFKTSYLQVEDTKDAAEHAIKQGYINKDLYHKYSIEKDPSFVKV